jgi:hypothetical protein
MMMLVFLVDQIQQKACWLFQKAWDEARTKIKLWERIKSKFTGWYVGSMEDILRAVAYGTKPQKIEICYDTS